MDKVLRICGKGKIRLRPDTVCAELTLEGVGKEYAEALQAAQEALEKVTGALEKSGFRKEELKTSDFRVETKYEGYRDEKGDWKQKFVGYQYTHALNLRFPADNTLLGEFISAVANSGAEPCLFLFLYGEEYRKRQGLAASGGRERLREKGSDFSGCGESGTCEHRRNRLFARR